MNLRTKPILEVGEERTIEFYPTDKRVSAKYLGRIGNPDRHIFLFGDEGEKYYIFMEDQWLIEKDRVLTYTPISSFSVLSCSQSKIKESTNLEFMDMLKELGKQI